MHEDPLKTRHDADSKPEPEIELARNSSAAQRVKLPNSIKADVETLNAENLLESSSTLCEYLDHYFDQFEFDLGYLLAISIKDRLDQIAQDANLDDERSRNISRIHNIVDIYLCYHRVIELGNSFASSSYTRLDEDIQRILKDTPDRLESGINPRLADFFTFFFEEVPRLSEHLKGEAPLIARIETELIAPDFLSSLDSEKREELVDSYVFSGVASDSTLVELLKLYQEKFADQDSYIRLLGKVLSVLDESEAKVDLARRELSNLNVNQLESLAEFENYWIALDVSNPNISQIQQFRLKLRERIANCQPDEVVPLVYLDLHTAVATKDDGAILTAAKAFISRAVPQILEEAEAGENFDPMVLDAYALACQCYINLEDDAKIVVYAEECLGFCNGRHFDERGVSAVKFLMGAQAEAFVNLKDFDLAAICYSRLSENEESEFDRTNYLLLSAKYWLKADKAEQALAAYTEGIEGLAPLKAVIENAEIDSDLDFGICLSSGKLAVDLDRLEEADLFRRHATASVDQDNLYKQFDLRSLAVKYFLKLARKTDGEERYNAFKSAHKNLQEAFEYLELLGVPATNVKTLQLHDLALKILSSLLDYEYNMEYDDLSAEHALMIERLSEVLEREDPDLDEEIDFEF